MTTDDYDINGMGDPAYPRPQDFKVSRVTWTPWLLAIPGLVLLIVWAVTR